MTAPQSTSAPAEGEKRTITAPLPWRLAGKGTIRGDGKNSWVCSLHWRHREGNGSLIIEAVNNYATLKADYEDIKTAWAQQVDIGVDLRARIKVLESALTSIRSNANCHTREIAQATMPLIFDIATRAVRGDPL